MLRLLIAILLIFIHPIAAIVVGLYLAIRTGKVGKIFNWFVLTLLVFLSNIVVNILGIFIVAIGIPFRKTIGEPRPFSQYPQHGTWSLVRLPKIFLPWDNAYDGLVGDKRGWYANYCIEKGWKYPGFLSMWNWAGIRNPANYWSRDILGCDVSNSTVEVIYGPEVVDEDNHGLHWLELTDAKGKKFSLIEISYPYPFANKRYGIYGRWGWKIKLSHAGTSPDAREQDRIKGSVYRFNIFKDL